jgi:hypothetical protein
MALRYYASLNAFAGFALVCGASALSWLLVLVLGQALKVRVEHWGRSDSAPQAGRCRRFDVEKCEQGKARGYAAL